MKIVLHRNFEKQYKKLRPKEQNRFKERRDVFLNDPFDPVLNNHPLRGRYKGYRSINVTGNLRAVYRLLNDDTVLFVTIDSHSNLYS